RCRPDAGPGHIAKNQRRSFRGHHHHRRRRRRAAGGIQGCRGDGTAADRPLPRHSRARPGPLRADRGDGGGGGGGRRHGPQGRAPGAWSSEAALLIVMEDDPPRGRREVARSAASMAEFALPPGTYYITARQGGNEARERLEMGSGDVLRRTLSAAGGRLGLVAT